MRNFLLLLIIMCARAYAQDLGLTPAGMAASQALDSTAVGEMGIQIDGIGFFHDNEFDTSAMTNGYTLPGARLSAAFTYNPLKGIHLELGASALIYDGANKYPCYAYHDITTWKGNQYQSGIHVLPWVRAVGRVGHSTFVLGNIYGGTRHRLLEPIFNPEIDMSADPEAGLQYLLEYSQYHLDAWVDWQSYIFKMDSHQEAFTFGLSQKIEFAPSSTTRLSIPLQAIAQHRGGQQDTTQLGTQTIWNLAAGLSLSYMPHGHAADAANNRQIHLLQELSFHANVLGAWQQAGNLWPFKSGMALTAGAGACLWRDLSLRASWFYAPKHFVSVMGNPFFSTMNFLKMNEPLPSRHHLLTLHIDYGHTFAQRYKLGIYATGYSMDNSKFSEFNFTAGAYLRFCPYIKL